MKQNAITRPSSQSFELNNEIKSGRIWIKKLGRENVITRKLFPLLIRETTKKLSLISLALKIHIFPANLGSGTRNRRASRSLQVPRKFYTNSLFIYISGAKIGLLQQWRTFTNVK